MNTEAKPIITTAESLARLQATPPRPQWRDDLGVVVNIMRVLTIAGLALGIVLRIALFVAGL